MSTNNGDNLFRLPNVPDWDTLQGFDIDKILLAGGLTEEVEASMERHPAGKGWKGVKRSWLDGRSTVEANGKTVAENEAESKAEVIEMSKEWLTDWPNLLGSVMSAVLLDRSLARRGFGQHWYSPKRLVMQALVNEIRCMTMRPERYNAQVQQTVAKYKRLRGL